MKINAVKRENDDLFFTLKKHYCPYCNERLEKTKTETVVYSNSEEAKNYDFSSGESFYAGNVKFIKTEFRCNKCGKTYNIKELKNSEKYK